MFLHVIGSVEMLKTKTAPNTKKIHHYFQIIDPKQKQTTPIQTTYSKLGATTIAKTTTTTTTLGKTMVVNKKQESYDIYIGRPSPFGNPFQIGRDGTHAQVIAKYREWIKTQPKLLALIPNLRGKKLGCFCKPLPCHGDILAQIADG